VSHPFLACNVPLPSTKYCGCSNSKVNPPNLPFLNIKQYKQTNTHSNKKSVITSTLSISCQLQTLRKRDLKSESIFMRTLWRHAVWGMQRGETDRGRKAFPHLIPMAVYSFQCATYAVFFFYLNVIFDCQRRWQHLPRKEERKPFSMCKLDLSECKRLDVATQSSRT